MKLAACLIEKCERPVKDGKRKHCATHLTRYWRHGSFDLPAYPPVEKDCKRCSQKFSDETKNKHQKFCLECKKLPNHKLFPRTYTWEKSAKGQLYQKTYYQNYKGKYKKLIYDYYGKNCNCCGETTEEFLTVDHVLGNGGEDRKAFYTGARLYQKIVNEGFSEDYQILCMNCNFGKRITGDLCPHQM